MSDHDLDVDVSEYGGSVNSDVSYFRGSGAIVGYDARTGTVCPRCGSGEVYLPMQTMDMPMNLRCVRCGKMAPSSGFND